MKQFSSNPPEGVVIGEWSKWSYLSGDSGYQPDNEDIDLNASDQLQFANKSYDTSVFSGLGRVYLRKNIVTLGGVGKNVLTQAMMNTANTIYHIQYDYDLNGQTITLPANVTLQFEGGSLANGTIVGNNTLIQGRTDLSGATLSGSFSNKSFSLYDAGCTPNDSSVASDNATRILSIIRSLENIKITLIVPDGSWYFDTPIIMSGTFDFICEGKLLYAPSDNNINSTALTIGTSQSMFSSRKLKIRIGQITSYNFTNSEIPDNIGVKIINPRVSEIEVTEALQFVYDLVVVGTSLGCSYNTFYLGNLGYGHCYSAINFVAEGNDGWINENLVLNGKPHNENINVYKGSMIGVTLSGSSSHHANNNVFLKPCVEGTNVGFKLSYADDNKFLEIRTELVTKLTETENCVGNLFYPYTQAVVDGGNKFAFPSVSIPTTERTIGLKHTIFKENTSYVRWSSGSTSYCTGIKLDVMTFSYDEIGNSVRLYGNIIYLGHIIDTSIVKRFMFCTQNAERYTFRAFDANDSYITSASDVFFAGIGGMQSLSDNKTFQTGIDSHLLFIEFKDAVKKVFVGTKPAAGSFEVSAFCSAGQSIVSSVIDNKAGIINTQLPQITQGADIGDRLYNTTNNTFVYWNGETWVDDFGNKSGLLKKGLTSQRPVLTSAEFGFEYFDTDLGLTLAGGKKTFLMSKSLAYKNAPNGADKYFYSIPAIGDYILNVNNNRVKVFLATTNDISTAETIEIGMAIKSIPLLFAIESIDTYPYILFANDYLSGDTIYFYSLDMSKWLEYDGAVAGVVRNGTTAQRPSFDDIYTGFEYFDKTIGKSIWYNGTGWVDATGAAVQ